MDKKTIKLLKEIKKCPKLYLGNDISLTSLNYFLSGYFMGRDDEIHDGKKSGLPYFQEYVQKKYRITSSQHWSKIITFYSAGNVNAVNNFFDILSEFYNIDFDDPAS